MTTKLQRRRRLALLKERLKEASLDSLLVTNGLNVTYLTGFEGHDSIALITPDRDYFITDSRYIQQAEETLDGFQVRLVEKSTYDTLSDIVAGARLERVGFEAMDLSFGVASKLSALIKSASFVPCDEIVERLRSVKDREEIALIKRSAGLNGEVFDAISVRVKPGATERSIAAAAEAAFIGRGARTAFEPIVASGPNSSKPHAVPTGRKIKNNSFVMIDMGANLKGYCSDLTRMVALGNAGERFRKISGIVMKAQDKAIECIKPGVMLRDIDAAGRDYIDGEGFGRHFGHSIGHGIGMSVHEKPTVSARSDGRAEPGMVFTIEPAIYVPGFGGVRIEDIVLVTDDGCEVLTK